MLLVFFLFHVSFVAKLKVDLLFIGFSIFYHDPLSIPQTCLEQLRVWPLTWVVKYPTTLLDTSSAAASARRGIVMSFGTYSSSPRSRRFQAPTSLADWESPARASSAWAERQARKISKPVQIEGDVRQRSSPSSGAISSDTVGISTVAPSNGIDKRRALSPRRYKQLQHAAVQDF